MGSAQGEPPGAGPGAGSGDALRIEPTPSLRPFDERGSLFDLVQRYTRRSSPRSPSRWRATECTRSRSPAARWLLLTHDRVAADEFPITQEFWPRCWACAGRPSRPRPGSCPRPGHLLPRETPDDHRPRGLGSGVVRVQPHRAGGLGPHRPGNLRATSPPSGPANRIRELAMTESDAAVQRLLARCSVSRCPSRGSTFLALGGCAAPATVAGFLAASGRSATTTTTFLAQALNDRFMDLGDNDPQACARHLDLIDGDHRAQPRLFDESPTALETEISTPLQPLACERSRFRAT
jgi:hypothetical protein